ncbi:hypothetical protein BHF71_01605 [Vulcanibacillus modesticaldus]|uniref:Inhibitor I9 domain-containing protein n=1 Tax=Vulcanibacillus modesticaldus TaxID=337097 RepID=A0A1D2YUG7_9BACI|nr:hypothetical protein [Vulcanibacillus modesticaldus]OEF99313.1 hypothetical protein BHF71_01605 [Vulcanibacillus modesticaldus]
MTSLLLILSLVTTSFAQEKSPPNSAGNTYFIAFKSKVNKNIIKNHGGEINRQYKHFPVIVAKLSEKAVTELTKNPNIAYIEKMP